MAKCPECGNEIEKLRYIYTVDFECDFDKMGCEDIDEEECYDIFYKCPECGDVLFEDEKEAIAFLRGEQDA